MAKLPEEKKATYEKACLRNYLLTSTPEMESVNLHVYKEGFCLEWIGTRCGFKVFAKDNDGELEILNRKPNENKLTKLYTDYGKAQELH